MINFKLRKVYLGVYFFPMNCKGTPFSTLSSGMSIYLKGHLVSIFVKPLV